jgi:hypothetical protein
VLCGNRGRKKTNEETSRSIEVMKQIQIDQEEKRRVAHEVNVKVVKNRYEAISPHHEHVPLKISNKQKCNDLKCCHSRSIKVEERKVDLNEVALKEVGKQSMLAPVRADVDIKVVGDKTYKKVSELVDSGAEDSVTNERTAPCIPIQQTAASRFGTKYTAADGRTVPNRGQQMFSGTTEDGLPIEMGIQITDVRKTLLASGKLRRLGIYRYSERRRET